jgi:hypothetical protein
MVGSNFGWSGHGISVAVLRRLVYDAGSYSPLEPLTICR